MFCIPDKDAKVFRILYSAFNVKLKKKEYYIGPMHTFIGKAKTLKFIKHFDRNGLQYYCRWKGQRCNVIPIRVDDFNENSVCFVESSNGNVSCQFDLDNYSNLLMIVPMELVDRVDYDKMACFDGKGGKIRLYKNGFGIITAKKSFIKFYYGKC